MVDEYDKPILDNIENLEKANENKEIYLIGINFSFDTKNIENWIMEKVNIKIKSQL